LPVYATLGDHEQIDIFPWCSLSTINWRRNVVDLGPVGALCSKYFLIQQLVWFPRIKPVFWRRLLERDSYLPWGPHDHVPTLRPRDIRSRRDIRCGDDGLARVSTTVTRLSDLFSPVSSNPSDGHWSALPLPEFSY